MRWSVCIFLIAVIVNVGMAEGSVVTNGDFETGNLNGWTWFPDASMSDVVMFDVYGGDGASCAFQANPTLASTGTIGTLTQWLQLVGGTTYEVSWEQGMQNIGPALSVAGTIEVRLGSQLLSRWNQGVLGANGQDGLREMRAFTPAVTDAYELNFRFVRDAGNYGDSTVFMYVDNICVIDPNAVPAPSSLACLVGVGVMVFGMEWWKKRRTSLRE